jgi:hypothetical protein
MASSTVWLAAKRFMCVSRTLPFEKITVENKDYHDLRPKFV